MTGRYTILIFFFLAKKTEIARAAYFKNAKTTKKRKLWFEVFTVGFGLFTGGSVSLCSCHKGGQGTQLPLSNYKQADTPSKCVMNLPGRTWTFSLVRTCPLSAIGDCSLRSLALLHKAVFRKA